ncbi:hypothetical protein LIER_14973 [Lithospermum erythrorhizon]|uniref:Uncharacterized protein n=1 Tax=Lithospermum erythrorhizon TaxID=34254 RepID=A0AAV3Q3C8_LITER
MDETQSLDTDSPLEKYDPLEENRIFDKYRFLYKDRPLDPLFIIQLIPLLWNSRPSLYTCPYLSERDPTHWVISPIKAVPQDVAQTLESRFNDADMGGNLQDPDVLSVEPLSIRPPSSSTTVSPQVRLTRSASQPARASQTADNPAVPHDVAQTLASRFKDADMGGNLQDPDVLSVEPLSIRPPLSSTTVSPQVRPTPSASQPVRASQTADNPGDPPTIIRDSLPVAFSDEDLVNFR